MLIRFPSSLFDKQDNDVLQLGNTPLARYRKATAAGKRTSFITEHTFVFVLQGHKFLHIEEQTHMAEVGQLLLMKRGIYAMSEFVPDGLNYEALLLFFTDDFVKKFLHTHQLTIARTSANWRTAHLVIPSNDLLEAFKTQFMGYFGKSEWTGKHSAIKAAGTDAVADRWPARATGAVIPAKHCFWPTGRH